MLMSPAFTSKHRVFCLRNIRRCGLLTRVKLERHYFLYTINRVVFVVNYVFCNIGTEFIYI